MENSTDKQEKNSSGQKKMKMIRNLKLDEVNSLLVEMRLFIGSNENSLPIDHLQPKNRLKDLRYILGNYTQDEVMKALLLASNQVINNDINTYGQGMNFLWYDLLMLKFEEYKKNQEEIKEIKEEHVLPGNKKLLFTPPMSKKEISRISTINDAIAVWIKLKSDGIAPSPIGPNVYAAKNAEIGL